MSTKKAFFALLFASFGALLGGCTTNTPKETSIPWSRPQSWEGNIPGMGMPSGR